MWVGAGLYRRFVSPATPIERPVQVEENREEEESSDASFRTAEEGLYGEYSSVGRASTTPDIRLQSPSGGIYSPSFPSTTSFRSTVSRIPRIQPVSTESALPSHAQPGHPAPVPVSVTRELPRTSQDPPVTVPPAMPFTAPPPANRGLMDRLKAQRAARMAQPPPAPDRAARDDLQQPPPSPQPPKLPSPPLQPFPTPQPEILLQPFPAADVDCVSHVHLPDDLPLHDVPYGATHLYEPTRQAPDSFAQPAFEAVDHYEDPYFQPSLSHTPPFTHVDHLPNQPFFRRRDSPSHFADADYGGEPDQVPYSPWTLPPHPQQAIHRVPSHLSEQTLLNEAASVSIAAPAPPIIDSPAPPPPPPNTAQVQPLSQPSLSEGGTTGDEPVDPWERRARRERRERQALLDWERARREEERRNQPPPPLLPPSHPLSPVKQVAKAVKPTEERPRSSRSHQSSASPAIPLPEPEPVLAEGWLLLPPTHRPFTDGLLRFSELWAPVYVLLTPATLHLGGLQGEQNEVNLPLIDIVRVVRLSNFNQPTFEPFRIDFASGEYLHVAGTQALDAAFWSLKIDNARSGAYRRPPSIASDVASFVSTTPSRLSLRGGHASSRSSSRTTLHPLPQEPTATPPAFAEISLKNVKDRAWMRDFHQAVPTHAYIEELPANAGSDDWGAIDDELRPTAQAAVPVAVGKTGWPARPPPEESPPPSRPQSELRHSDVDALGFILGKLQEQSNALDAQAVRQESKLQLSREELRRLEERIRERLEREGRKPSRSEQKVLDRVEWLLHLNDVQLRKYAYAMLREGSPSASDSTARAFQKELDLMTTIERELESLRREAKELPTNDRDSVTSSADSLAQRGPTRSLARKPSAISRFSANTSENIPSPTTQMQPQPLPIPRSSPRHSPVSQARQSSQELYYVPENSPVLHEATTSTFQETFMQESPVQEARRGSSTSERRRRLQELFLDVEYLFQQQQAYIASSHDQQERLRRSLGKILNLLQHDSVYRSETLSSLVGHLYDLTSHNLDIPLAPPHFPPAPPHPALSYSETTGTKSSSSSSSAPHMPPKKEMHLLPSDGRMAPRLIPKALAPPLAPPQAAVARAAGPAAAGAGGKGGVRRATNGKRPLFGVDAALQPAHHFHRWRAGPEAAKAAREVTTLAKANEPEPPRTVPAPTDKALQPTPFVEQDERVEKALETLSRPEAKQEKAGAKSGLSGEAAAKKAVAVWEQPRVPELVDTPKLCKKASAVQEPPSSEVEGVNLRGRGQVKLPSHTARHQPRAAMAKRGAEKQLTQDNVDDDERQEEGGSGDFRKASDQALLGRKIRGLPKRRGGGAPGAAPAAAPAGDAPKPSPFGGVASPNPFAALSGSSSTPAAPNPFAFGSSAVQPASNGAAPSFTFGSTTSTFSAPASSSSTPSFGAPATSSFTFGAQAKPAAPAPAQSDKLKYYTSLRALNVSLLEALSSRIDKDPFIDLSADGAFDKLKQRYEEHRARVDKEHGMAKEDKMAVEAPASSSAAAAPAPAPAFEIPEIFRNPPKPVPIADLTDTSGTSDAAPASASSSAPQKPTVAADDIPDIFKNPPKPVPIADLSEEPAENKVAPPAPPAVFAFAGSAVKSTSSGSSTLAPPAGGFVFKPDSAPKVEKSSFTFPTASSSSSSTPSTSAPSSSAPTKSSNRDELKPPSAPKLAPAKLTNPPSKPSPLRFGESVSPPTAPEKGAGAGEEGQKPKGGFSFGAQFGKMAKGEKEGEAKKDEGKKQEPVKEQEEKKETPKPAFSFGSSGSPFSFGSATSTAAPPASTAFSFGSAATPSSSTDTPSKPALTFGGPTPFSTPASTSLFSAKPASSPPIATSFGSSSPPSFGFGAALQTKDKDQPAPFTAGRNTGFAFGSNIGSGGSTGSTGFTFGSAAPASDDKNQATKTTTGFSFAATPPASTSTTSTSAPAATSSTPFSFTASSAPPAASSAPPAASSAPSTAGETDSRAQTPGANPFTAPGEGEEGEDVLHSVRGKVWKIEGGEAKELGIANVAVKERKEGGKVRLLARNETNGAVLINFSLYSSLSLKKEKVFVTFLGFGPDAKPVTYRLRFKDVAMVEEFVDAVEEAKKKLPAA